MTESARRGAVSGVRPLMALLVAAFVVAMGNALAYTWSFSNPVAMADAWYFLDVFVSRDLSGELAWTDYFAKRAMSDHSQPLHRLILALNTRWFDLDFMLEAVLGVVGIAICALLLLRIGWSETRRVRVPEPGDVGLLALVPILLFSLNSTEIYLWSLVTLFYLMLPFALLVFSNAHPQAAPHRRWALPLATFAAMLVLDGAGLLAALAALSAVALAAWRGGEWREAGLRGAAVIAAVLLYRIAYAVFIPPATEDAGGGIGASVSQLFTSAGDAWRWLIYPATGSIVHVDHLDAWFGLDAAVATILIGLLVLGLHGLFWYSAWRSRVRQRASFVAVCLMLFVYAMVAGIVLGRVPGYGSSYLWQHRYVAFYQLANVALVLQWIAARAQQEGEARPLLTRAGLPLLACAIVVALQVTFSVRAWELGPYFRQSSVGMADTIHCLSGHPELAAPVCEPNHVVCGWPPDLRNRLVGLLREHRLNVFSPAFQQRNRMQFDAQVGNRCVPAK